MRALDRWTRSWKARHGGRPPPVKTEVIRILERLGIPHRVQKFAASRLSAEEAADVLGVPLASIVKTIVLVGDRTGVMRVCLSGTQRLSLKKLARASGNKQVSLAPLNELRRLTGYLRGGVSPLGGRTEHPVYCDAAVLLLPRIFVNGGMRGLQIDLSPQALVRAANAVVADLSETPTIAQEGPAQSSVSSSAQ